MANIFHSPAQLHGAAYIFAALAVLASAGCGDDRPSDTLAGSVTDTAGQPVSGATVYAVPADLVTWAPVTASDVTSTVPEDFDEPLEGLVDAQGKAFARSVTDSKGAYAMSLPSGRYYLYVAPDPMRDPVHLPGGSASRRSLSADELIKNGPVDIKVSSQPSSFDPADYIGSGACIGCHADKESWQKHAHANGIHEPGQAAPLQSASRIDLVDGVMLARFAAGTTLYFYGYDETRGAEYVTRADGNPMTDFWDGGIHSKLNRQQYSDMRKSKKYANPRMLVACTDCHDVHGGHTDPVENPRGLIASVDDNALCQKCHGDDDVKKGPGAQYHTLHELIGSLRQGVEFRCVNCHMDQIGKTGAGRLGNGDAAVQYFENDITDHTFILPRKDDPGVANHTLAEAAQGKAMPIPYTRSCSNCHVLDTVSSKH